MEPQRELTMAAGRVAALLAQRESRVVFAESCTGGLIAATLTSVPGISQYLCGSAVVYRLDTKARWLSIPASVLKKPGPVSRQVAKLMATNVLKKTPEARIAVAITGHLGPNAPSKEDGLVYIGTAMRASSSTRSRIDVAVDKLWLSSGDSVTAGKPLASERRHRQMEAATMALNVLKDALDSSETA